MKETNMSDDEIKILGQQWKKNEETPLVKYSRNEYLKPMSNIVFASSDVASSKRKSNNWLVWLIILVLIIIAALIILYLFRTNVSYDSPHYTEQSVLLKTQPENTASRGYIEITEKVINDVPLMIYAPHNAVLELTVGLPDAADSSIIFVAQAADIGADNSNIIGDFILAGKLLARGISKKGFCAIINQEITIGVATETPLLQEAISKNGYFFRQYPLVKDGMPIDNKPKGKAIRKALAIRDEQVLMIASRDRESFHDFAQALADSGVSEAIYLVGSDSYGWYVDEQGKQITFGVIPDSHWENVNYLVFRK